ncbi:hypothetical protein CEXT_418021 [Caerostris extrusa]|uniref:Uncharacterized protein n=1 Tax=Caerostris extrusa TaxID=172846 RepID=A0AAV4VFC9_CAEEX|nr:hypothetical protein CEXT_418021 [Caerostris extrusa]
MDALTPKHQSSMIKETALLPNESRGCSLQCIATICHLDCEKLLRNHLDLMASAYICCNILNVKTENQAVRKPLAYRIKLQLPILSKDQNSKFNVTSCLFQIGVQSNVSEA